MNATRGLLGLALVVATGACRDEVANAPLAPSRFETLGAVEAQQASVTFTAVLSDDQVLDLARRHQFSISALKLSVGEFRGTHRYRVPTDPGRAVSQARSATIRFLGRADSSSARQARRFLQTNPRSKVAASEVLGKEARSLLAFRQVVEKWKPIVATGSPFIYGFEITGSEAQISALEKDWSVRKVARQLSFGARAVIRPPEPVLQERGQEMQALESVSAGLVYDNLEQHLRTAP